MSDIKLEKRTEGERQAYLEGFEAGKRAGICIGQRTEWIPVSERLPEVRDWYLGVFQETDTKWINTLPFICDYVGTETPITTSDLWIIRQFDEPSSYCRKLRCVAWTYLPEPYEGGE